MPALPATFNDFLGNAPAIENLRTAIAAGRLPHSLILAGPAGAGKYTLALMLTMAVECERQPRDLWSNGQSLASFCGVCRELHPHRLRREPRRRRSTKLSSHAKSSARPTRRTPRVLIQPHPRRPHHPPRPSPTTHQTRPGPNPHPKLPLPARRSSEKNLHPHRRQLL